MRRRALLGAATALCGHAALVGPAEAAGADLVRWHTGERGRSDPFVSWTIEVMRARFGLRVRRTPRLDDADLIYGVLSDCCRDPDAARIVARFLVSAEARAHAIRLAGA